MTCWSVRTDSDGEAAPSSSRVSSSSRKEGLRRGRILQTLAFRYKREFRQECIPVCHDDDVLDCGSISLMTLKNQSNWIWPMPSACRVPLALLCATIASGPSFSQGTAEQRLACTPDVLRLCSAFIPNADEITTCLIEKNAELSDACKTVFEAGMNQLPSASKSTGVRKRTIK
jgi:hypothetical protein